MALCESGGGRPGLPVPNEPGGFCGDVKQHRNEKNGWPLHPGCTKRGPLNSYSQLTRNLSAVLIGQPAISGPFSAPSARRLLLCG